MKRFLSVMLAAMMLLSVFAINASAYIHQHNYEAGTASDVIISENYDGETVNYFYSANGGYNDANGNITSTVITDPTDATGKNKVFNLELPHVTDETTEAPTYYVRMKQGTSGSNNLTSEITLPTRYIIEFDVYSVNNMAGLTVGGRDALTRYGYKLNPNYMKTGVWYTYRAYFDEGTAADKATLISNVTNAANVYVQEKGKPETGRWLTSAQYAVYDSGVTDGALGFYVTAGGSYSQMHADVTSTKLGSYYRDAYGSQYYLDNITVYNWDASEHKFEYAEGIYYDDPTFRTLTYKGEGTEYSSYSWKDTSAAPTNMIVTLDAARTAAGQVLVIAPAANGIPSGTATIYEDTAALNTWYTYRLVCHTVTGRVVVTEVWQKAYGSNTWTKLEKEVDWTATNGGKVSDAVGTIRMYLLESLAAEDGSSVGASWSFKNVQITDALAVVGDFAAATGNTYTASLNACATNAGTTAVLAVYDGDVLADVDFEVIEGDDTWNPSVEYEEGNTAIIYAWDSLETGKPLLSAPYDVSAYLTAE